MDEYLKAEYWRTVISALEEREVRNAPERVADYRRKLADQGVDEMIYHQEPSEIVDALASQAFE